MKSAKSRAIAAALACGGFAACVNVIAHDESAAAKAATQFAQVAFIDRDDTKARGLITPALAQQLPDGKLAEMVAKLHPKSFPARVAATEFEPHPGQRGMTIYLKGTGGDDEAFFYRLLMEGDAPSGYRVAGLYRGSGPHPSSNKRPLN